jgi:hypothetical protein
MKGFRDCMPAVPRDMGSDPDSSCGSSSAQAGEEQGAREGFGGVASC